MDTQVSAGAKTPRLTDAVGSIGPRGWASMTPTSFVSALRTKPRSSSRIRSSSASYAASSTSPPPGSALPLLPIFAPDTLANTA